MPAPSDAHEYLQQMQDADRWLRGLIEADPLLASDIVDAANRYTLNNTGCTPEELREAVRAGLTADDPALAVICATWYSFVAEARYSARA